MSTGIPPSVWMDEPEGVLLTVEAIMIERGKSAAQRKAEAARKAAGAGRRAPGRRS